MESFRIEFILKSLNDLDIFAYNIGNALQNVKYIEKNWTKACTEFCTETGMVMIIAIALYGLKSSGAACMAKLE